MNTALVISNKLRALALRDAVYGSREPVPVIESEIKTQNRWGFLEVDFCGRHYMTQDEMIPLAQRFVSEVGPCHERGEVIDEGRRRQFRSWMYVLVKREARWRKPDQYRRAMKFLGAINVSKAKRDMLAVIRKKSRLALQAERNRAYMRERYKRKKAEAAS